MSLRVLTTLKDNIKAILLLMQLKGRPDLGPVAMKSAMGARVEVEKLIETLGRA